MSEQWHEEIMDEALPLGNREFRVMALGLETYAGPVHRDREKAFRAAEAAAKTYHVNSYVVARFGRHVILYADQDTVLHERLEREEVPR